MSLGQRKPIRQQSAKGRVRAAGWRKARAAVIARDEWCRAGGLVPDVVCAGEPHVHHKRRRSQGGSDHPSNLILLCEAHHDYVHSHVAAAVELGLLIHRGAA